MSVRQSLLAILDQGPCYGYQLRHEFTRRTGSTWPLNVGQIYNTLERLERDGLVARGDADPQGHVYWRITASGAAEAADWLHSPVVRTQPTRDELAMKIALAATLPGVDVESIIRTQREVSDTRLQELRHAENSAQSISEGAVELAGALIAHSLVCDAEAEVRWLDDTADQLARHANHAMGLELTSERPKRGRPTNAVSEPTLSPADAQPVHPFS